MTAPQLLEFVRRDINDFVDGSTNGCNFQPHNAAIDTAAWLPVGDRPRPLGLLDPVQPDDGGHPVSGNRQRSPGRASPVPIGAPGAGGRFQFRSRPFQGEPLLQASADDERTPAGGLTRISPTQNRNDPVVKKVQQALLVWRPDCLPRFGADGDFGGESATAVHRFKVDELQ
ncbi:MAG: hypothetical protein M3N47_08840, partial [Chloroflexota bacterium]|nr:hypothetical protein [Chloroflexota bacterium]